MQRSRPTKTKGHVKPSSPRRSSPQTPSSPQPLASLSHATSFSTRSTPSSPVTTTVSRSTSRSSSSSSKSSPIINSRRTMTSSVASSLGLQKPELFQQNNFIGGEFVPAKSGKTIEVVDPGNNKVVASIAYGDASDVRDAIDIASEAQRTWAALPSHERCGVVKRWGELVMENQDDLAKILSIEQGKPLKEAKGEIAYAASFLTFYGEYSNNILQGESLQKPTEKTPTQIVVEKVPIGVVGAITPWNFPSAMITRKAGPAFVAGCSMVLKPSELTPYSANALAVLGKEAGIPDGIFNIITGDAKSIGEELTSNAKIRKITFTGSTRVGKLLLQQSADTVKRLSMELGGNAPFIVFDDADLDLAIDQAISAKTRNAGQTCVTPNRFLVHQSIYDRFANGVTERMKEIKVGYAFDEDIQMGPLINAQAVQKVRDHIDDAIEKGAVLLTGGQAITGLPSSNYFQPTVIRDVTPDMKCFKEETFGPLLSIIPFKTDDEAIAMANDTRAGLASYVFTKSVDRQSRLTRALDYGMVGCNQGSVSAANAPFGGVKESGIGREGSQYGIYEYVEIKAVHYHHKF